MANMQLGIQKVTAHKASSEPEVLAKVMSAPRPYYHVSSEELRR